MICFKLLWAKRAGIKYVGVGSRGIFNFLKKNS